jgi:ABC-type antimicrobial peptide transport system permease subunit
MALGADAARVLRMVLRQGGVQVAIGVVAGLGLAYAMAALMGTGLQTILFNVDGRDPMTYGAVAAIVAAVAMFATWVPARRATRVHPVTALRAD